MVTDYFVTKYYNIVLDSSSHFNNYIQHKQLVVIKHTHIMYLLFPLESIHPHHQKYNKTCNLFYTYTYSILKNGYGICVCT